MKTEERIEAGVGFLTWFLVYMAAAVAIILDLTVWRPW